MGSSITEFRGFGFWARDVYLELWLRALTLEIDEHVDAPQWLKEARAHWYLHGCGIFSGWVSPNLDEIVVDDERRSIVRSISLAAQSRLLAQGDEITEAYLKKLDSLENIRLPQPIHRFAAVAHRWLTLLGDDPVEEPGQDWDRLQRWPPQQETD